MRRWLIFAVAFLIPIVAGAALRMLSPAPDASPWRDNYFPNVSVVNQDGKTLKFYDDIVKGKIVVFNFMFTGCSALCPLTTSRLVEAKEQLGDAVGRDIFMYSISLDPEHDDPAALKKFAAGFRIGEGWQFLTGKPEDMKVIRERLGERSRVMTEHQAQIVLGNDVTGQWGKDSAMSDIDHIVATIRDLDPKWRADTHQIANAKSGDVVAYKNRTGQALYIKLCSNCHTVGRGDRIGPDLAGVAQRRDPTWLSNFILTPEKMRAAKDPVALALLEKYNGVLMPNLGLSADDVQDVLAYIESEAGRIKQARNEQPAP